MSIDAENLQAGHTNLSLLTDSAKTINAADLHASPIGMPVGVPAVWCEIVD